MSKPVAPKRVSSHSSGRAFPVKGSAAAAVRARATHSRLPRPKQWETAYWATVISSVPARS